MQKQHNRSKLECYTLGLYILVTVLPDIHAEDCKGKYYQYETPVLCFCNATGLESTSRKTSSDWGNESLSYQLVLMGSCLTLDESFCNLTSGACPYNLKESPRLRNPLVGLYALQLDRNHTCSEVNQIICGAIHRTGLLCSRCAPGYGLSLYSRNLACLPCWVDLHPAAAWILHLLLELLPLTLFFILALATNIQATKPPLSAYIFYCQFFTLLLRSNSYIRVQLKKYSYGPLHTLSLSAIELWNLDFLRHVIPPFCLSTGLGNLQSVHLELCCALLPLILVVAVSMCIKMHARDVRLVVRLWRPFRHLAMWRRRWNAQASVVNVFLMFLILTMSKLLTISVHTLYTMDAFQSHQADSTTSKTKNLLYLDPNKKLRDVPILTTFIVISLALLVFMPMCLNALYLMTCLRRCKALQLFFNYPTLYHFMDAWQGHFRSKVSTNHFDYRHASILFFIHRFITVLVLAYTVLRIEVLNTSTLLLSLVGYLGGMALFYALARPYSRQVANISESLLFGLAAAVLLVIICIPMGVTPPHRNHMVLHANIVMGALALPTVVMSGSLLATIFRKVRQSRRSTSEEETDVEQYIISHSRLN